MKNFKRFLSKIMLICIIAGQVLATGVCRTEASEIAGTVSGAITFVETAYTPIEDINLNDINNWRYGQYSWTTGKFEAYGNRICLNDYNSVDVDATYEISVSDNAFHILIREMDSVGTMIKSLNLADGDVYTPSSDTSYIGVSIYNTKYKSVNYAKYTQLFNDGFVVGIKNLTVKEPVEEPEQEPIEEPEVDEVDDGIIALKDTDLNDFSIWRNGTYSWTTGAYESYGSRICLDDYRKVVASKKYQVSISDSAYHLLIRVLDKSGKMIQSFNLADGDSFTTDANAYTVGIGIYNPSKYNISWNKYKSLFESGFSMTVSEYKDPTTVEEKKTEENTPADDQKEETVEEIVEEKAEEKSEEEKPVEVVTPTIKPVINSAYDELAYMLSTADTTTHDFTKYKVTRTELYYEILPKIKKDMMVEYYACIVQYTFTYDMSDYVRAFTFYINDSEYYQDILERERVVIKKVLSGVDNKMTDLDKALYVHEYIVNTTEYVHTNNSLLCYSAGNVLANGEGVCMGYAYAMMVLLNEMGVETRFVASNNMNHGWVYIKLDGEWYHIDPTWDDTQPGANGEYMHRFLIRNDQEFSSIYASRNHYDWEVREDTALNNTSKSTKYTDWFVHDVYGTMYYNDGLWYYYDAATNSIVSSDILGNNRAVVVDGQGKDTIKITGMSGNVLTYTVSNATKTITL